MTRTVPLLSGRYVAFTDLHPDPPTGVDPDDWWAKQLTGYDPNSRWGFTGEWVDTIHVDGTEHVYISPCVGNHVRVAGPVPVDAPDDTDPDHRVVHVESIDPADEQATLRDVPTEDAIETLQDSLPATARRVAHAAVGNADLEDLLHIIALAEGPEIGYTTDTVQDVRVRVANLAGQLPNQPPGDDDD